MLRYRRLHLFSGWSCFFGGFVVFFCSLGFLCWSGFGRFVVLFGGLGFLCWGFFGRFVVLFSGLSFLSWGFLVRFLMVSGFSWCLGSSSGWCSGSGCSWSRSRWSYCIGSEGNRRQTHGSSNDQG
ncbi:Uncharacterised protein [Serratia quinivorans]|nr:Uncharacterised protein [Serratia quinivorans]